MDKAKIEALRDRYSARADRNYRNYQETGVSRYSWQQRQAADIVDLANLALNAADTATRYGDLKCSVSRMASEAGNILHNWDEAAAKTLLKRMYRSAVSAGLIMDRWGEG